MSTGAASILDGGDLAEVVAGALTEETDLSYLLKVDRDPLIIDLAAVTRINSCGVREWLDFVRQFEESGRRFILRRCAPVIVIQINLIYNFVGQSGVVESILAPYLCTSCGAESMHLQMLDALRSAETIDSVRPCLTCGGSARFADVPELYLSFLNVVLRYIGAGLEGRKAEMQRRYQGAGLGLFMVFSSINKLIFNLQLYRRCEIIAVFDVRSGLRSRREGGRSLHFFVVGSSP